MRQLSTLEDTGTLQRPGPCEMPEVTSIPEALALRSESAAAADYRFLHLEEAFQDPAGPGADDEGAISYSYGDVHAAACRAADHMAERGIGFDDKVLLILPTGPAFMAAFFGCQMLGAVPVPAVPPISMKRLDEYLSRMGRMAATAEAAGLVTTRSMLPMFRAATPEEGARRAFATLIPDDELLAHETELSAATPVEADHPAMIQFTSGSTGDQKGVVLSHRNLLENIRAIGTAADFRPGDVCVSWLPLYHDMGLIGKLLAATVWGMPLVIIPPQHFVRFPSSWLRAITRYKGTCSAAPNFAYSLCVKKISKTRLAEFDLSSWRLALCGAEPIDPRTVETFIDKFENAGFARETFFPVFGMAENSLAVSFPPSRRGPVYDTIDRKRFEQTGDAVRLEPGAEGTLTSVSVGAAMPGHQLRIVGEDGRVAPDGRLGEIEIRGPSLMQGYYKNVEATAEVMRPGGWYRTGDLGYTRSGELFVTGRLKEMIIKGGRNYFPQDIEAAAGRVEGVRVGCCAAFGLWNSARGTEDLILVCETRPNVDEQEINAAIRRAVHRDVGTSPDKIVLVERGTVPKTSSGKIQRRLTRRRYVDGDLTPGRAPFITLARVAVYGIIERFRMRIRELRRSA